MTMQFYGQGVIMGGCTAPIVFLLWFKKLPKIAFIMSPWVGSAVGISIWCGITKDLFPSVQVLTMETTYVSITQDLFP